MHAYGVERHERECQRGPGEYATQDHRKPATEYCLRLVHLLLERGDRVHRNSGIQPLHNRAQLARDRCDAYLRPDHRRHAVLRRLEVRHIDNGRGVRIERGDLDVADDPHHFPFGLPGGGQPQSPAQRRAIATEQSRAAGAHDGDGRRIAAVARVEGASRDDRDSHGREVLAADDP